VKAIEMDGATIRQKVAGSLPDEVIRFFNLLNPSSRTIALGSIQNLTEMSKAGNFAISEPSVYTIDGPPLPVTRIALPCILPIVYAVNISIDNYSSFVMLITA
jgi:hypothetical protein